MSAPIVSYAQRFEDLYLMSCLGDLGAGFYVDIGSGHPVYDNMSFAFYLKGWSGITVEPNPWLARLTRAVRPRDRHLQTLVGAAAGEATFFLVRDFHGFSTTIEHHARAAQTQFGKSSQALTMPVTTLRDLCAAHAPTSFEFLKIDVEGTEKDVVLGGDWHKYRPKVVVAEALAPYTLAPAWQDWEPFLTKHGYRYVLFDSLNRYYLAEEASELAERLEAAPASFAPAIQFRNVKSALSDDAHPDRKLATVIAPSCASCSPGILPPPSSKSRPMRTLSPGLPSGYSEPDLRPSGPASSSCLPEPASATSTRPWSKPICSEPLAAGFPRVTRGRRFARRLRLARGMVHSLYGLTGCSHSGRPGPAKTIS
jgi:FkbM family methyltransferase